MLKIAITGTGSLVGQAVIKSIKKSHLADNIVLFGFDYFQNTVGSYWCNRNELLPDILNVENVSKWKDSIIKYLSDFQIQILFVGVDFELPYFSRFKAEMEAATNCIICVSNTDVINIANDKYLTYEFLKANNLNYPRTCLPGHFNDSGISFPLILKPRVGARSRDVYVIKNHQELSEKLILVNEPIIQELVGDVTNEYTCGVIFFDDKVKASIALKRTLKEGNTNKCSFNTNTSDIIYEYINSVAFCLKPFGACNLQLRIDKDGLPKIFEINPRHSGTTYMRALFGFNEVEYIINYLVLNKETKFNLKQGEVIRFYDEFYIEK
jgi:carbamoyl-phosphate synthase large subunit